MVFHLPISDFLEHRSFVGYSTANYALSEVRNPVRTIKRAAPLALISVTAVYLLVNVGYFAVVSKGDIIGSRRIVALVKSSHDSFSFTELLCRALFFRNLFGPNLERVSRRLPVSPLDLTVCRFSAYLLPCRR